MISGAKRPCTRAHTCEQQHGEEALGKGWIDRLTADSMPGRFSHRFLTASSAVPRAAAAASGAQPASSSNTRARRRRVCSSNGEDGGAIPFFFSFRVVAFSWMLPPSLLSP